MSKYSCLLKIYGITVKSYTKDKSNDKLYVTILHVCMSFNEHCLVVFTTFINFVNSFRFDMNKL